VTVIALLLVANGALHFADAIRGFREGADLWVAADLVLAAGIIACGLGCWTRQPWARIGTIMLTGLNALGIVVFWVQHPDLQAAGDNLADGVAHGLALALNIVTFVYLLRPGVAAAFRRRT
jgi:hypothetical protein